MSQIKGIIFDLGNTLIRFTGDWQPIIQQGAQAMARWYVKKKHIRLDEAALVHAFLSERANRPIDKTHQEIPASESLRTALQKIDAPPAAEAHVGAALKVYFEPEAKLWQPYPDAVETLRLLREQGYRLGLYSNASDDPFIQRLVNKAGLRPWLSPTFSSAGWGWRKPKPEPFRLIADRWQLPPESIVMIGDTLRADVLGAQKAGMRSILVTMDESPTNRQNRHIIPTATAASLSELPEIITRLG